MKKSAKQNKKQQKATLSSFSQLLKGLAKATPETKAIYDVGRTSYKIGKSLNSFAPRSMPVRVNAPVASSRRITMGGGDMKATVFSGSEMCGTVYQHESFYSAFTDNKNQPTPQRLNLNPGLAPLFPVLSVKMGTFEKYRFRKLRFEFRTNMASDTNGQMYIALDKNPNNPAIDNEEGLASIQGATVDKIWIDGYYDVDSKTLNQVKLVRSTTAPTADENAYDLGNLYFCSVGSTSGTAGDPAGSFWVHYECEGINPIYDPKNGIGVSKEYYAAATGVSVTNIFGTLASASRNSLESVVPTTGSSTLNFIRSGKYLLDFYFLGTVVLDMKTPVYTGTATVIGLAGFKTVQHNTAGDRGRFSVSVNANRAQTLIIDMSGVATTINTLYLRFVRWDGDYELT